MPKRSRAGHSHASHAAAPRPLYRRIPWTPFVISIAVVLSGAFAVQPVTDAVTRVDVGNVFLERPLGYIAIAPLSNVLDTLTLMSVRQHIALLVAVIALFTIWRAARARRVGSTARRESIATALLLIGILLTYVAVAVLPRPMAQLMSNDVNVLRVDFHSHTSASHDGRPGWNSERNRAWHRDGGYDVAYMTDHATVAEAERGVALNPNPAREGVILLQAIEVTWTGEHVAILGGERTYRGLLTENRRDVDTTALRLASLVRGREPVVVWNHPHQLNRLPIASGSGTMGVRAIEFANGAPDDMDQVRLKRADILALAERSNIALTTGSDNHGWGRTAPAWTLMIMPRWQEMSADILALRIETIFRTAGIQSTSVVERRVADPGSNMFALALTVFTAPARMLTTLSSDERVAWLLWTWFVVGLTWWLRRRRRETVPS